ncbi:polysaccharide deacetylase family protein [Paenibacillus ginsengarvi]|uniref:Polysaccharide deacetylase n=1 Tax=Paenibacillus ginsengarvi TaxID=400777 RepID=A0A3B0CKD4_9BACL|nr:polysaccharide deacetylase family protein [Paenibacillus ginsengarvi]RKN85168.1 polysaccharide deacetylase [Paenibacillus ginsengarvi]
MRTSICYWALLAIVAVLLTAAIAETSAKQSLERNVYYKDKALVLVYHDVKSAADESGSLPAGTISEEQLQDHLRMLAERGFQVIGMELFAKFMLEGKRIPPNAIVLTFDDGYESFYTNAAPVLGQFGVPASNFIIGVSSDLYNPEADPHLSWAQMRELKRRGMGFYSHTYNLHRTVPTDRAGSRQPALTARKYMDNYQRSESEDAYRKRVFSDLTFLEKRLREELGSQSGLLAFPYGAYDEIAVQEAHSAGIELFFTIEEGSNRPGTRLVKRLNAGEPYVTSEALWGMLQRYFDK